MRFVILLFFILANLSFAFASVKEHTLDNGLRVIVKQWQKSPVFLSQIVYKVGASDEPEGLTGISHVLEHMMFKGTKKYKANEASEIIAKNGGRDNAFTSRDYTAYHQMMHKDKLAVALELEADRMVNLQLSEAVFLTERNVVVEERHLRTENNPNAFLYERFNQFFYDNPYQRPVIGWMADINNITHSDVINWYQQWYRPDNAFIVVVGDVEAEAVFELVEQYFGHIKNTKKQFYDEVVVEAPKRDSRHFKLERKAQLPYYMMAYPAPSLINSDNEKEIYALVLLAYLLDKKLNKQLFREQESVYRVNTGYSLYSRYNNRFSIAFTPIEGIDNNAVRKVVLAKIAQLQDKAVSEAELKQLKTQLAAAFIYQQDSLDAQVSHLSDLVLNHLPLKPMDYIENINQIGVEDIKAVAQHYLKQSQLYSAELVPTT